MRDAEHSLTPEDTSSQVTTFSEYLNLETFC